MKTLNSQLQDYITKNGGQNLANSLRLQKAWELMASEQALEHTDNVAFKKSNSEHQAAIILVFLDSSSWAAELSTQKELYRILFEKELNQPLAEVRFLVSRAAALKRVFKKQQKAEKQKQAQQQTIKLTEEEYGYAREISSVVKDPELRESLLKAEISIMIWKKSKSAENEP
jgi:hypothetical protein